MTTVMEPLRKTESSTTRRAILALLWLIPFFYILWLIARLGVDVPYCDEMESDIAGFVAKAVSGGGITWAGLVAQHNESRKIFPRLIFALDGRFTHWDPRYEMVFSACMVLATSLILLWIALRSVRNRRAAVAAMLFANFLLFSPVQWWNFLYGITITMFMPPLALVVILAVLISQMRIWPATIIAIAAAFFSTYSYANGMIVWAIVIPAFLLHRSPQRWTALAVWLLCAAASIGYYFYDYHKPGLHPSFMAGVRNPVEALYFMLAFLGNGLRARATLGWGVSTGAFAAILWALGSFWMLLTKDTNRIRRAMPWMVLGVYSIGSALITTAGRVGFGAIHGMDARYTTFAVPLWLCLVPLWLIVLEDYIPAGPRFILNWASACIAGIAIIIGYIAVKGIHFVQPEMMQFHADRMAARAAVQFSSVIWEADAIADLIYPDPVRGLATINQLETAGAIHIPQFHSALLTDLWGGMCTAYAGSLDELHREGLLISARGWAFNPDRNQPPDAVLLTFPDSNGSPHVFALAYTINEPRPDVVRTMHMRSLRRCGWSYTFDLRRVPPNCTITAWAYDSLRQRAFELSHSLPIPPQ